ncbi:MAG: class I SAM-dependent methyltransferase [Polyangiaceae bacterium]|nr:class I SAM-dependent methyltransferase [Polyangiaceae bacterium]
MAAHDLQAIKELYDDLAARYDHHLLVECVYNTPKIAAEFLAEQLPGAHGLWLDIGAGTGLVGHELKRAGLPLSLVALDISRAMLSQISSPNYVACCEGSADEEAGFDANAFDGAVAIGVFDHISDPTRTLSAIRNTLRPAAFWLLSFCQSPHTEVELVDEQVHIYRHPAPWFRHCCKQAGFAVRSERLVDGYESYGETVQHRLLLLQRDT